MYGCLVGSRVDSPSDGDLDVAQGARDRLQRHASHQHALQVVQQPHGERSIFGEPCEGVMSGAHIVQDLAEVDAAGFVVVRGEHVGQWGVRAFESRRALRLGTQGRVTQQGRVRQSLRCAVERSHIETMSRLTEVDINRFVNLVEQQMPIRDLVEESFLTPTHPQRTRHLRDRRNSEMYVCLKNIFGFEQLDDILLSEFKDLADDSQDIYRYVCAIQAMGGKVHRQLPSFPNHIRSYGDCSSRAGPSSTRPRLLRMSNACRTWVARMALRCFRNDVVPLRRVPVENSLMRPTRRLRLRLGGGERRSSYCTAARTAVPARAGAHVT